MICSRLERGTRRSLWTFFSLYYLSFRASYPLGQIGFIIATKGRGSCKKPVRKPVDASVLKYYTSEIHEAAFVLPAFAKRVIEG